MRAIRFPPGRCAKKRPKCRSPPPSSAGGNNSAVRRRPAPEARARRRPIRGLRRDDFFLRSSPVANARGAVAEICARGFYPTSALHSVRAPSRRPGRPRVVTTLFFAVDARAVSTLRMLCIRGRTRGIAGCRSSRRAARSSAITASSFRMLDRVRPFGTICRAVLLEQRGVSCAISCNSALCLTFVPG